MRKSKKSFRQGNYAFTKPNFSSIPFVNRMVAVAEDHLRKRGFLRITAPRIVLASGACENVDTLFEIGVDNDLRWFRFKSKSGQKKKKAYFAQTAQLYLESLLGKGGFEKLYCIGPSARAEKKIDKRHLTEFEMIEIEFRGNFKQLLREIELFIKALVKSLVSLPGRERKNYGLKTDFSHLKNHPDVFEKINYAEAIEELGLKWGSDISSRGEQELIKKHGGRPIFIIRYPNPESPRMKEILKREPQGKAIKFFNMLPDPDDPDYVLSADCIVPDGGECVGAAARVWQFAEFKKRLFNSLMFKRLREKEKNAALGFSWYLEMLTRFPSVPHAGCGFGLARIFQYLLAEPDITKVVTFPANRARIY